MKNRADAVNRAADLSEAAEDLATLHFNNGIKDAWAEYLRATEPHFYDESPEARAAVAAAATTRRALIVKLAARYGARLDQAGQGFDEAIESAYKTPKGPR